MSSLTSLELCAGGGGQALGLEQAGFRHLALAEIDKHAQETLRTNRPEWHVPEDGDIIPFDGTAFRGVDLLAAGIPCPPFSKAGKQLGQEDERDLFPSIVRLVDECRPRAVMIENVRGLLDAVFEDYRNHISSQLKALGYTPDWQLLNASDFGVSQLRPRVVFVAVENRMSEYFEWPEPIKAKPPTVGELLYDQIAARGWQGAKQWRERANDIAPTIVGGSLKHGGPDLGPTRARRAWQSLGVDGIGIADEPPPPDFVGDAAFNCTHGRTTARISRRLGVLWTENECIPAGWQCLPAASRASGCGKTHRVPIRQATPPFSGCLMTESLIAEARRAFHMALLERVLRLSDEGVPSNADKGSPPSINLAKGILDRIEGEVTVGSRLAGQMAGANFERICAEYVKLTFQQLTHLRPGTWEVSRDMTGGRLAIAQFDQYEHLAALDAIAKSNPDVAAALGSDYLIKPDVIIARSPEPDEVINAQSSIADADTGRLTSLREINNQHPILHASISCKWTIRSDRAQNARSEGLNLVRNRKGRLPHIVVIIGEPSPGRIASIALGTGDIDCVYHFALPELIEAARELGYDDASEMIETMVSGKRLRDISDLPFDLVV